MEEALKKASAEWRTTFDSTRDDVFMLDNEFAVIKANAAGARMFGLPSTETIGKPICGLFQCAADGLVKTHFWKCT
jgi:PAS domain S-box-containing protein